jgi:DNA-binding response OmpR family regulator
MNEINLNSILLIEDDPGDARLFEEMLELQGYSATIYKAIRLSDTLDYLRESQVQIILLDLNLPDSSGLSTLTRVMDVAPLTPIIVLTGLSDESVGIEALKAGAQDYLVKGDLDGRMLKRSMHYALERKKLEIVLRQTLEMFEKQAGRTDGRSDLGGKRAWAGQSFYFLCSACTGQD